MTYHCEAVDQSAQPVLSIRARTTVSALPELIGKSYGAIAQYLAELGQQPAGAPFAAYHNMDMDDLDVEMGFPVSKELPGREDIQSSTIPEGKNAICLYTGPYNDMGSAYQALTEWITQNGYAPTGVSYEFYLNSPEDTLQEELLTKIVFPLM
jgi:effector-binding domain-containing protein